MRTLMDMPYHDISLALNIPEGTAMSHVHRARMNLRSKLADLPINHAADPADDDSSSPPTPARTPKIGAERNGHVHG